MLLSLESLLFHAYACILTKYEAKMGGYWPSIFFTSLQTDLELVKFQKLAKKTE